MFAEVKLCPTRITLMRTHARVHRATLFGQQRGSGGVTTSVTYTIAIRSLLTGRKMNVLRRTNRLHDIVHTRAHEHLLITAHRDGVKLWHMRTGEDQ
jgi:hypothetical protein